MTRILRDDQVEQAHDLIQEHEDRHGRLYACQVAMLKEALGLAVTGDEDDTDSATFAFWLHPYVLRMLQRTSNSFPKYPKVGEWDGVDTYGGPRAPEEPT